MPKTVLILLAVLVLAAVGGGLYYWHGMRGVSESASSAPAETTALPSGDDVSDAALGADLEAVDAQMGGFDDDAAAADAGIASQESDELP